MFNFIRKKQFFLSLGQFFGISAVLSLLIFQVVEQKASSLEFEIELNRQLIKSANSYLESLSDDQLVRAKRYSSDMILGIMADDYFKKNMQLAKAALPNPETDYHFNIEKRYQFVSQLTVLDAEAEKSLLTTMTIKLAVEELLIRLANLGEEKFIAEVNKLSQQNENTYGNIQNVYFEEYASFTEDTDSDQKDILRLTKQFQNVNLEIEKNISDAFNILWKIRNETNEEVAALETERKKLLSMSAKVILAAFFLQLLIFLILQSFEYREGRILYD